jgi:hypothetical protein
MSYFGNYWFWPQFGGWFGAVISALGAAFTKEHELSILKIVKSVRVRLRRPRRYSVWIDGS